MAILNEMGIRGRFVISAFAAAIALGSLPAKADFYLFHWDNHQAPPTRGAGSQRWMAWGEYQRYSSSRNFDAGGNSASQDELEGYTQNRFSLGVTYGIGPRLSLFGRASWAHVGVDGRGVSGTIYGFTDQTFGGNARLLDFDKGFALDAQVQIDLPAYSNTSAATNGTPFLGDGSLDITGGGFITLPFYDEKRHPFLQLIGGVGYTYRSDGFSAAVPWSVTAKLAPGAEGLVATAGVAGIQSLETDDRARTLVIDPNPGRFTGGSLMTNTINPSLMTLRASLGYQSSPEMLIAANFSHAFSGTNAPQGTAFGVSLQLTPKRAAPAAPEEQLVTSPRPKFISYSLEAKVNRVNERVNSIRVDRGADEGVERGQEFDFFRVRADGSLGDVVARGRVAEVMPHESVVTVVEYYREVLIQEGFIAKRVVD